MNASGSNLTLLNAQPQSTLIVPTGGSAPTQAEFNAFADAMSTSYAAPIEVFSVDPEPITKRGQTRLGLDNVGAVIEHRRPRLLQLKVQLRDVHPAVWRRLTLGDNLSIADLHRIIQVLMDWDDEHLHCFRIQGQDYGIEYTDGMPFDEDAETVPLSRFGFRPTERFLYEYDFTDGWEIEIRVEKIIDEAVSEEKLIPRCIAGREPAPPDGSGGPRIYAEQRVDAVGPYLTEDMRTVGDVLVRLADGDDTALADPETFFEFKQAVSRLKSREPLLAVAFPRAEVNAALRQAFTTGRVLHDPDDNSGRLR